MSRRADIALLVHSMTGGGAEQVCLTLGRAFRARGLSVDLVLARAEGPLLAEVPEDVRIVDCGVGTSMAWSSALVAYLRESRPRSVLAHMEGAGLVALWARLRARVAVPVVVAVHNMPLRHAEAAASFRQRRLVPLASAMMLRGAEGLVAVSAGVAVELARMAGIPRERITVIPNPVETERIRRAAIGRPDHPWLAEAGTEREGGRPVILAAGRLTAQKDFPTLIRAFALAFAEGRERLVIFGEGEDRADLETLVAAQGLADRVALPGHSAALWPAMARAQLFVLSSRWEGFGNVLVEALACGCPVVATDCPSGPSEILAGGAFGRLVPPADRLELANAMRIALTQPRQGDVLQRRAEDFAADRAAEAYLALLQERSA